MSTLKITEHLYDIMYNALPLGVFLIDFDGYIVFSNKKSTEIFGYTATELKGKQINSLVSIELQNNHKQLMSNYYKNPLPRAMSSDKILRAITKEGKEIQLEIGLSPITYKNENFAVVSIIEFSNKIFKLGSFHDPLTGLANRRLFLKLSNNLREIAIRSKASLTIIFIDLDNFKMVNDLNSHEVGDTVLCDVADIIQSSIRKNDIAARIGGDEFLICLYDVKNNNAVRVISEKIISKIATLNNSKDAILKLGASIGTVTANKPGTMDLNEMIKVADKLMYQAKHSGKNRICSKEV